MCVCVYTGYGQVKYPVIGMLFKKKEERNHELNLKGHCRVGHLKGPDKQDVKELAIRPDYFLEFMRD